MARIGLWVAGAAALAALVLGACGPIDDFGVPPPANGRVCYTDGDCVPNECCGQGGGAIHIQDAPDCRGVRCSGVCPEEQVNCGCGYPICRNSQCVVAVNYADEACVP